MREGRSAMPQVLRWSPSLSSLSVSGTPWNAITEFRYLLLSENREGLGEKRKRKGGRWEPRRGERRRKRMRLEAAALYLTERLFSRRVSPQQCPSYIRLPLSLLHGLYSTCTQEKDRGEEVQLFLCPPFRLSLSRRLSSRGRRRKSPCPLIPSKARYKHSCQLLRKLPESIPNF